MFFESSGRVFDHLSVDSSPVCRISSCELVDGVAEFLHRERLPLVLVFVFVRLRR